MMRISLLVVLILLVWHGTAVAEDEVGYRGWGPRLGATIEPDQIHFGAHVDFGHFAEHIRLQPNVEVGFGEDLTLAAFNIEGSYRFRQKWDTWTPYAGGGLGINLLWVHLDRVEDDTDTEFGLNALAGIEKGLEGGDRFFVETKLGFEDSPDIKLTIGWTFF